MAAESGMHMAVAEKCGRRTGTFCYHDSSLGQPPRSSVSFRKEMQYPIDIGGITDMAEFEFKIKVFFDTFNLQGEGRTIRKMINDGTDTG